MGWGASDRIRIAGVPGSMQGYIRNRPRGVTSGRWISLGPLPVWVRLGRRSSWHDEDLDAEMIKPVEP